jgi:hypothetical protein
MQNFSWKTLKKEPLGKSMCRWKNNIKVKFNETVYDGVAGLYWIRIGSSGELSERRN